jgi:hypothetical protein
MMLSKSFERRINQNIAIDFKDVPLIRLYKSKNPLGITVMAKSKWMNAVHIRGTQALINSLKGSAFVDKVDFANKTLNQAGKTAVFKQKNKGTGRLKLIMLTVHPIIKLRCLRRRIAKQNYTGTGKIIAIMDAGFFGVNNDSLSKAEK